MRKWRATAIALFVVGLGAQNAIAAEFEGAGIKLCSDFTEFYKSDPSTASNIYFDWAEGFMSGLNIASTSDTTAFKTMTAEQQEAHIRNFCDAYPTAKYFKAVLDLYTTIYPKKEK